MRRLTSLPSLGLGLLAVVLIAVMGWLGLWQFGVYDTHQRADAEHVLTEAAVPLGSLLGPDQAFPGDGVGRPVTVSGRWLPGEQLYVTRLPEAAGRVAVVTPLVTSTGSAVLVVRGAAGTLAAAMRAAAPSGRTAVALRGVLEPSTSGAGPPDGRRVMTGLAVPSLVNAIGPDLYAGYVIARPAQNAGQGPALDAVSPPLPSASHWAGVRNLLYACQWWLFGLFVAVMWFRVTGDMIRRPEPAGSVRQPPSVVSGR